MIPQILEKSKTHTLNLYIYIYFFKYYIVYNIHLNIPILLGIFK